MRSYPGMTLLNLESVASWSRDSSRGRDWHFKHPISQYGEREAFMKSEGASPPLDCKEPSFPEGRSEWLHPTQSLTAPEGMASPLPITVTG